MGWESAIDGEGKTYYFNRDTGETSWDKPEEYAAKEERRKSRRAERKQSKRHSKSPKRSKSVKSTGDQDLSAMFSSGNSSVSRGSALSSVSGGHTAMSKQFFKEHRKCHCCKGYVYGCKGVSCQSLGHCVCTTMDAGKALGSTRKYGKYEIIR